MIKMFIIKKGHDNYSCIRPAKPIAGLCLPKMTFALSKELYLGSN